MSKARVDEFQYLLSMADLGRYVGTWIALVGNEIVAVGDRGAEVFRKAKEKYPNREPFIVKVSSEKVMLL